MCGGTFLHLLGKWLKWKCLVIFLVWFNVLKTRKTPLHSGAINFMSVTCVREATLLLCRQQLCLSAFLMLVFGCNFSSIVLWFPLHVSDNCGSQESFPNMPFIFISGLKYFWVLRNHMLYNRVYPPPPHYWHVRLFRFAGGYPVYCRTVSFVFGLFLVDASSTHPVAEVYQEFPGRWNRPKSRTVCGSKLI